MTDTAADYRAEAVTLAQQTAEYRHATQTATLTGRIFREGVRMSKTMAEVLAEHRIGSYLVGSHAGLEHMPDIGVYESRCRACGPVEGSWAAHQAAALSAAGFGLVAAAKAEALEEAADEAETLGIVVINPSSLRARAATVRGEG